MRPLLEAALEVTRTGETVALAHHRARPRLHAARGHLQDSEALAAVVRSPAAYIGMIGSRRKTLQRLKRIQKRLAILSLM